MKKWLICILLVAFCLSSCGREITSDHIVGALLAEYGLTGGTLYSTSGAEGSEELTEEIFLVLYGRVDGTSDFGGVESATLWQGGGVTRLMEVAAFVCVDRGAAEAMALTCRRRLEACSVLSFADMSAFATASVRLHGRVVVYAALPDPDRAERILDRLV